MQVAGRPPRSGRSAHRRISSASSVDDDAASVSSANSRSSGRFSHADYSAIRAAAGISRMRQGGRRRRSLFPDHAGGGVVGGLTEVVRGGRRTSIYSLSALADAGKSYRKRRRSTFESWGKAQPPGVKIYFDKVFGLLTCRFNTNQLSSQTCKKQEKYTKGLTNLAFLRPL